MKKKGLIFYSWIKEDLNFPKICLTTVTGKYFVDIKRKIGYVSYFLPDLRYLPFKTALLYWWSWNEVFRLHGVIPMATSNENI